MTGRAVNRYIGTDREHLATEFDYPVQDDGKTMNVNVQGTGERKIVILAGRGVTAPSLDFKPLIEKLRGGATVYTIDYFGSGLSDMTDRPRTRERIAAEIDEALARLGVDTCTIVAHSISGIYALHVLDKNPELIEAFVGIDTATPDMDRFITPELIEQTTAPERLADQLYDVREDIADVVGYEYSDEELRIMRELHERNSGNDAIFQAIKASSDVGESSSKPDGKIIIPPDVPTLFFLSSESASLAPWYVGEHEKQCTTAQGSGVIVLEGGHFLHHSQADKIAHGILSTRTGG